MSELFDKKDVFSWANCEEARTYIDKKGYFGDFLEELKKQIKEHNLKKLLWIDDSNAICFHPEKQTVTEPNTAFFLPVDKVKQPETKKKWRAFENYNEFQVTTGKRVGDVITLKNKSDDYTIIRVITGSCRDILEIGASTFNFLFMFDEYLWLDQNNEWQPFGVINEN